MDKNKESGQAMLLTITGTGLLLLGALGLAIDSSQLYGQRQSAQVAADAAAQAAIVTIFNGGSVNNGTAFKCSDLPTLIPCKYAQLNGFSPTGTDVINVTFPNSVPGVTLSNEYTPAAVKVVVTRPAGVTFLRLFGAAATRNVSATATAAIINQVVPVPIEILHPSYPGTATNIGGALNLQGGTGGSASNIQICGGPSLSIQVNSNSQYATQVGGSQLIDLSRGGPDDTDVTNPCHGSGSDFGATGGATGGWYYAPNTIPSWMSPTGSATHFRQPTLPIQDPLRKVAAPAAPAAATAPRSTGTDTFAGVGDCPASAVQGSNPKEGDCTYYFPGTYTGGLTVNHTTAIFQPGLYYIQTPNSGTFNGTKNVGFGTGSGHSDMQMCTNNCQTPDTSGCCVIETLTGGGTTGQMVVYLAQNGTTGQVIAVGNNANMNLVGSSTTSSYKGILFFADHNMAPQNHSFGGGGSVSVRGTFYLTNCPNLPKTGCTVPSGTTLSSSTLQNLFLTGNSSNATTIRGQIIVDTLGLGGGGGIRMLLDPSVVFNIAKIALVN